MRKLRQLHLYIGVFFAPAILFFAISGGLQTFRLQQASGWDGAPPPQWMAWMGKVHIDQAKLQPAGKAEASKPKPPVDPVVAAERAARQKAALPMKIFTVALAIALSLSVLLGAGIALGMRSTRRVATLMLIAGAVVPILLLR
ncbi:hypothetical protein [Polymorphobacter fuscus]|nr:hypothetical protein [Polymorphobacter fuscus]NJC09030.1 hypothetical protein [Polymorphobacter fuscus]